MKRQVLIATAIALLVTLCSPEAAQPRPARIRAHHPTAVIAPHHRMRVHYPVQIPIVVPWHLRHRRDAGWVYGFHGGYHWAPNFGWHNLTHEGTYRPTDEHVYVPMSGRDWRFRGRF